MWAELGSIAVGGLLGSKKSGAEKAQERILKQQAQFNQQQMDNWNQYGAGMQQGLLKQAQYGIDPNRLISTAQQDVSAGFNASRQADARDMARRGISADSGAAQASRQDNVNNQATALAGAANRARSAANNQTQALRQNAVSMSNPMTNGTFNSMQGVSNGYGQIAQRAGNSDGALAGLAGNLFSAWKSRGAIGNQSVSGLSGLNNGSQQDLMIAEQMRGFN